MEVSSGSNSRQLTSDDWGNIRMVLMILVAVAICARIVVYGVQTREQAYADYVQTAKSQHLPGMTITELGTLHEAEFVKCQGGKICTALDSGSHKLMVEGSWTLDRNRYAELRHYQGADYVCYIGQPLSDCAKPTKGHLG